MLPQRFAVSSWTDEKGKPIELPDTYLVMDLEAITCIKGVSLITEIGHHVVKNGKIQQSLTAVLNWFGSGHHSGVTDEELSRALSRMQHIMKGAWSVPEHRMRNDGVDPVSGLVKYEKFCRTWADRKIPVLGHNFRRVDEKFLQKAFDKFGSGQDFRFHPESVWDTLPLYKDAYMRESADPFITTSAKLAARTPGETLQSWDKRVVGLRLPGIPSSALSTLLELLPHEKTAGLRSHTAADDAKATHFLFEHVRECTRLVDAPTQAPQNSSTQAAQQSQSAPLNTNRRRQSSF